MASTRPAVMFAYNGQHRNTLIALRWMVDALIVPGTTATVHHQAVPALVSNLDRDYAIDPRTPLFQFGGSGLRLTKASALTLASAYGEEFLERFGSGRRVMAMTAEEWCLAARSWAAYQRQYAPRGQLSLTTPPPAAVLPVYLMTDGPQAPEWELSLAMLRETKRVVGEQPVWGVAALRSRDPTVPDVRALGAMLDGLSEHVDTAFVWLDACVEHDLQPQAVAYLAGMAERRLHLTIYSLYGGYLSLLLHKFGWAGTTSGIGYSESRAAADLAESGGGGTPRYYLPLLHAFVRPVLAEAFIVRAGPVAECRCSACQAVAEGVTVSKLDREQLAQHYIYARDAERRRVMRVALPELIAELRNAHQVSIDVGLQEIPSDHLPAWASGLENAFR